MVGKVRFELTKRTSSFTHGFTTRSLDHLDTFQYIWWAGLDSNQRIVTERGLQPPAIAAMRPTQIFWCTVRDLNPEPTDYESVALTN